MSDNDAEIKRLESRISELNGKFGQTLLFLSFALVVVATLKDRKQYDPGQQILLSLAARWWTASIFPMLVGILPVKEFRFQN